MSNRNNKRGKSVYIDSWNPDAKKYINVCTFCGRKGYSPAVEEKDFVNNLERKAIYDELKKMFNSALVVDSFGRCENCAERQEK